ncbi:MAG: sulfotransferase family 2 domain-containing protein [Mastigocoleus sp.]
MGQFFLERLPEIWKIRKDIKYKHLITHSVPFLSDITDEDNKEILLDFVGKIENINEDFEFICNQIGISNQGFPHVNKTRKNAYYSTFYNKATRKIVEELYGDDIDRFEYSFEYN